MKKLPLAILIGILGVTVAIIYWGPEHRRQGEQKARLTAQPRRDWKNTQLNELAVQVSEPSWISNSLAEIKKRPTGWYSDSVIVMENGDWLAYASICSKEDPRIHDLFLAKASDGKWYYSTYHFCRGMVVLMVEDQPADLKGAVRQFALRPFDGRSDECLKHTWPPHLATAD